MSKFDMSGGQFRIRPAGDPTFSPVADQEYVDAGSTYITRDREVYFSHASGVVDIGTVVPVGAVIRSISVGVTEVFNGSDPRLMIGDVGDTDRLMTIDENDLTSINTYEAFSTYVCPGSTQLLATVLPDSSTTGEGLIVITYTEV